MPTQTINLEESGLWYTTNDYTPNPGDNNLYHSNYPEGGAYNFLAVTAIPATATNISAFIRMTTTAGNQSGTITLQIVVDDEDPATVGVWAASPGSQRPQNAISTAAGPHSTGSFNPAINTFYFGEGDLQETDIGGSIQNLLDSYGDIAVGDRFRMVIEQTAGTGLFTSEDDVATTQLIITWTESATNDIAAALTQSLSLAADLDAQGTLSSAQTVSLTQAADLDAEGQLAAATTVLLAVAADLDAAGELAMATTVRLTVAANLDALGTLNLTQALAMSVAADLDAIGRLEMATTISLALVADVTGAGNEDIAAVIPLTLTPAADLDATGALAGSTSLVLSVVAGLTALGRLEQAATLALSLAADLDAAGELAMATTVLLTFAADMNAAGALSSTQAVALAVAADMDAAGRLEAAFTVALTLAADITTGGDIAATIGTSLALAADLDAVGSVLAGITTRYTLTAELTDANAAAAAPDKLGDPTISRPAKRRFYAKQWNMFAETLDAFLRRQERLVREAVVQAETDDAEQIYEEILEAGQYSNELAALYEEMSEFVSEPHELAELRQELDEPMIDLVREMQDEQDILAILSLIASNIDKLH